MAKAKVLRYDPGQRSYTPKSGEYVVGRIRQATTAMARASSIAREAAKELPAFADELKQVSQLNTDTMDHMVNLFTAAVELGIPADKRYVNFDAKSAKPADIIFRVMGMLQSPIRFQYVPPKGSQADLDR
ncbi:MAG: hypothetical protein RLZZ200_1642, partial [Pseudomonadota bacterium]